MVRHGRRRNEFIGQTNRAKHNDKNGTMLRVISDRKDEGKMGQRDRNSR